MSTNVPLEKLGYSIINGFVEPAKKIHYLVLIALYWLAQRLTCSHVLLPPPFAHDFFACNVSVPAKALESYLDLRRLVEENVLVSAVLLSLVSGFLVLPAYPLFFLLYINIKLYFSLLYFLYFYLVLQEFTEPTSDKLLPDLHPQEQHVFTLVLDLNETLLYTDWKVRIWLKTIFHFPL